MRLLGLAGMLFAVPALAQQTPPDPDEIVVTGHGLTPPPGDAVYAVVTIPRERLTGTASGRLEDALRDTAGLAQFRRSDSRSAHPTSQGVTLRGLGGNASSRALLLLDGVPQSDPFGGWVAFPAYLPERLGSARVIRGGGSGYAGPGALAGTTELASASPAELGRLQASAAYGSREGLDARAVAAIQFGTGFATVAGQYARGDGFIPIATGQRGLADRAAPYSQASLALRSVIDLGGAELQTSLSGFSDHRGRGIAFTQVQSEGVDASVRVVGRTWSALAYLQTRGFSSGFASIDDARSAATATLDQYNVPATGMGGRLEIEPGIGAGVTLRLGGDVRRVSGRTQELFSYVAGQPTRRRVAGGESTTLGAFADASFVSDDLTLSAGGRLDHWSIARGALAERPLAAGVATETRFADRRGWQATGRIGAAYAFGPVSLRAAAYRGWRLPTLNELYRPFRAGADATAANAALNPERLTGIEAGVDWRPLPALSLRTTFYWNRLTDGIANVFFARGPGTFAQVGFVSAAGVYRQRRNLPRLDARGIEFDARYEAGKFSVVASYAYVDSRVGALQPAQTAAHHASATFGWDGLSLTARYDGPQYEDDQNLRRLKGAVTLDAAAQLPVTRELAIEVRAENVTDARIEAGISGPGVIERASPRTLWLGLRLRLR
ncbi:TonB-dependent receptor [Sphingomonas soli]|uniref:TonB-dependent receptor n=1 Tax=Sphingomonas soli TaxID=266127 RepID=UPI00083604A2|nr:TonB-dependent receptor [Sphingomonas soli]